MLQVFHASERNPTETLMKARASDVLAAIPELLAHHNSCDKVVVYAAGARLFSVDCKGNRLNE